MYNLILDIDFAILDFIASLRHAVLDRIMVAVTSLGDNGFLWIVLAAILLCFPKTRKAGITVALALIINFIIVNITLKPLVARLRPYDVKEGIELLISAPADFSFPSGHTAASFAAATSVLFYYRRWGVAAVLCASLIALSRLYLYVHFLSDVLGGAFFGVLAAFCSCFILHHRQA